MKLKIVSAALLCAALIGAASSALADDRHSTPRLDERWQNFFWESFGDVGAVFSCAPGTDHEGSCFRKRSDRKVNLVKFELSPEFEPIYQFNLTRGGIFTLVDGGLPGDQFVVRLVDQRGKEIIRETRPASNPDFSGSTLCFEPLRCLKDRKNYSRTSIILRRGKYTLHITPIPGAAPSDEAFFSVIGFDFGHGHYDRHHDHDHDHDYDYDYDDYDDRH